MLFSATIAAAIAAGYWFLRARCPACRTTGDVDLRALDFHRGAAVTALTPALSCRSCRPNAPFAELVCLSKNRKNCARSHILLGPAAVKKQCPDGESHESDQLGLAKPHRSDP